MAHGGTIWAEHNRPSGTVFIFRLPIDGPDESDMSGQAASSLVESTT
jgi:signal transduction histidine kinase